jgi:hypothetical protein
MIQILALLFLGITSPIDVSGNDGMGLSFRGSSSRITKSQRRHLQLRVNNNVMTMTGTMATGRTNGNGDMMMMGTMANNDSVQEDITEEDFKNTNQEGGLGGNHNATVPQVENSDIKEAVIDEAESVPEPSPTLSITSIPTSTPPSILDPVPTLTPPTLSQTNDSTISLFEFNCIFCQSAGLCLNKDKRIEVVGMDEEITCAQLQQIALYVSPTICADHRDTVDQACCYDDCEHRPDSDMIGGITGADRPTDRPTDRPVSISPTRSQTKSPTVTPTVVEESPTTFPTDVVAMTTAAPSDFPSDSTDVPTKSPSNFPAVTSSQPPTSSPVTNSTTSNQTSIPSAAPTDVGPITTDIPSKSPTDAPTMAPSQQPSNPPPVTISPTSVETTGPTTVPTAFHTDVATVTTALNSTESVNNSSITSDAPTELPSDVLSKAPSTQPTKAPGSEPVDDPVSGTDDDNDDTSCAFCQGLGKGCLRRDNLVYFSNGAVARCEDAVSVAEQLLPGACFDDDREALEKVCCPCLSATPSISAEGKDGEVQPEQDEKLAMNREKPQ